MQPRRRPVLERLLRPLGALLILLSMIGPLDARSYAAAQSGGDDSIDLAAMALTPWDLADAGLDGYGHGYSEMVFLDGFAAGIAGARDVPDDEVREQLEDAGFVRAYYAYFYSPEDVEETRQTVASYVFEFEDEAGAAAAWDYLEDESGIDDTEDIDGFDDYGDTSEATLSTGEDAATGDPYRQIDVSSRVGNLHTGVTILDWHAEDIDENIAAELIGFALEQVDHGDGATHPALSNMVPRLTGEPVGSGYDTYLLRDGEAIWLYGETPDAADRQQQTADDVGKIEEYRLWQRLTAAGGPDPTVRTYATLLRFEDDRAAETWVANQSDVVERDDAYTGIEISDADYGDGGFAYTAQVIDANLFYRGITFQFGKIVAQVDLAGALMPTDDAIEAFADETLACLEDEGCLEPIELPAGLERYLDDAADATTPEADETPDAEGTPAEEETEQADGGPVLYESALYDFAIAFNLNDWQFTPEDDPTDDAYEWLRFDNGVSTVWMVADPDYTDDELGDCVTHYLSELGWEEAWELEPLDELTVEQDRAFATFTMTDPLFGMFGYLSVECRPIDSSTTLMITHFAGTDSEGEVPDDEIEKVQALIDGLQIAGAGSDATDGDESVVTTTGASYTSETWRYTVT